MSDNLHCGACMQNFDDVDSLNAHIKTCPAARALLPAIFALWNGQDQIGHPLSHFIQALHKNAHLIRSYAYAIADEIPDMQRSKIHSELCEKLGLEYNKFSPFTYWDGNEFPDRDGAEVILWDALRIELYKKIKKS